MGRRKFQGNGTRSLGLLCVIKDTRKLLQIIVSLLENFLTMTSLSYCYMLVIYLLQEKNISNIDKIKKQLGKSFAMKDMRAAKQILVIRIMCNKKEKKLWMSQEHYIERLLQIFKMESFKAVRIPLATHFKLSTNQSPSSEYETFDMFLVQLVDFVKSRQRALECYKIGFKVSSRYYLYEALFWRR